MDDTKKVLAAIVNLSKYHKEHEKFYSEFPLQQAAQIRKASQILKALADKWSGSGVDDKKGDRVPRIESPSAQRIEDIRMEGTPDEVVQLKHDMSALADNFGRTGTILSVNMESPREAARPLMQRAPSKAVVGDRQKIIVNDWRAAYMSSKVSRLIKRAIDILDHVDFTPTSSRTDPRSPRFPPKYLRSASELLERAAETASESEALVHDNEQRWQAFRQRVSDVAKRSSSHDAKGGIGWEIGINK